MHGEYTWHGFFLHFFSMIVSAGKIHCGPLWHWILMFQSDWYFSLNITVKYIWGGKYGKILPFPRKNIQRIYLSTTIVACHPPTVPDIWTSENRQSSRLSFRKVSKIFMSTTILPVQERRRAWVIFIPVFWCPVNI